VYLSGVIKPILPESKFPLSVVSIKLEAKPVVKDYTGQTALRQNHPSRTTTLYPSQSVVSILNSDLVRSIPLRRGQSPTANPEEGAVAGLSEHNTQQIKVDEIYL